MPLYSKAPFKHRERVRVRVGYLRLEVIDDATSNTCSMKVRMTGAGV